MRFFSGDDGRRLSLVSLPLALLLLAVTMGPSVAADHKTFAADIAPHQVAGGASEVFTATLANQSLQQQLGSANITAPRGFSLTATDAPSVDGVTRGTATIENGTLELRDLAAPPQAVVTVAFTATTPCDTGTLAWQVLAKQSNNFQGPPGNDLSLDVAASDLSVTVTSGCPYALRFVAGRQPADAEQGAVISSVAGDPGGPPVQVEVVDKDGNRVPDADATITMAPGADPSAGATLSGTLAQTAVGGVAAFPDLAIDLPGMGYTLVATSPGLVEAASEPFNIYADLAVCAEGETCQTSAGDMQQDGMTVNATARGGAGGGTLGLALDVDGVDCGDDFSHFPKVVTLVDEGVSGKCAEVTIDRAEIDPAKGIAHFQVCAKSDTAFMPRGGGDLVFEGLLPDCGRQGALAAPCVLSRTKMKNGDGLIKAHLNPTSFR